MQELVDSARAAGRHAWVLVSLLAAFVVPALGQTATNTTLAANLNPAYVGQSVMLTATVTGSSPTGTVTFKNGSTTINTVSLSSGTATAYFSNSTPGTYSLTATYNGNAGNAASTSAPLNVTINPKNTSTTTVSSSLNPAYVSQSFTLTANVSGSSPTGSVTFYNGGNYLTSGSLSNGVATATASISTAGTANITATYNGDTANAASTSTALAQTINPKVATTTTVTSSLNPAYVSQTFTLTANVTGSSPTGSVTFYNGATYLGAGTLTNGVATTSAVIATAGAASITATYNGNTANATSTSAPLAQTINAKNTTTTTLTSSVNPAGVFQPMTLTASVSGSSPTGTVTFRDGANFLGNGNVTSGTATLTTQFSTAATRSLTAQYNGDFANATSTSAVLSEVVNPVPTTTTLTCPASTTVLVSVNCTVTVTAPYSTSAMSGQQVRIMEGATTVATGNVTYSAAPATHTVTLALPAASLPVNTAGSHTLQAQYVGTATTAASTSANVTLAVQQKTTTTTLAASPTSAGSGQLVTLTANVTGTGPTGNVAFKDGATTIATSALNNGTASATVSFSTGGAHSLTAVYAGDTNNATSTSSVVTATISASDPTTTALAVSANPVAAGVPITITATVSGSSPTGTVQFKDGATVIGSSALSAGQATLNTSLMTAGTHALTATYSGDIGNASSTSSATNVTVNQRATTTALATALTTAYQAQPVALTATITGAAPSGSVTFSEGGTTLGTATISNGAAVFNASFTALGSHTVTATYPGDANNLGSSSSTVTVQTLVGPAPPVAVAPVRNYEYDANGNPTKTIQAPGVSGFNFATTNTYDALNRLKDSTNAKSGKTQFGYNGREDLTQVTDPRNLVTQYPRNGLGDATSLVSPDTGTATHTYDAAGNLKTRTDNRGVLATYSYDALNRLTGVVYSQSGQTSLSYGWAYDQTGAGYSNGVGRLTSASHPVGSSQYAYDSQGRLLTETQRVNATSGANAAQISSTVGYTYDAAGNLTSLTYPSGRKLVIGYTGGQPTSLGLAPDGSSAAASLISQIQWEPFGGPRSWLWQMASGTQPHTWLYDSSGRLVRQNLGSNLRDISYDAADRITSYQHYDATTGAAQTALDQSFSYDELGRLTGVVTATASWSIGYDANGNRTSVTLNGVASTYTTASTSNRLTSTTNPARNFGYDNAGNTTSDTYTATYTLAGRMATLTKAGTTATYSVDGFGRRVRKFDASGSASTVVFVYDQQGQLLGEYNSAGAPIREVVWLGNVPVAVFTPDPANAANPPLVYYIHSDHLATPRIVLDRSGNQRWNWLAEPFGTTAPNNNPSSLGAFAFNLRFPGQYADAESGLFYNYFRDYDASTGRYAQSDPIGLEGGINTYAYVDSDPASFVDEDGLQKNRGGSNPRTTITVPSGQRGTWSYGRFYPSLGPAEFRPVRVQTGGANACGQCFDIHYVATAVGTSRSTHTRHANEHFLQYISGRGAPSHVGGTPAQQVVRHMTSGQGNRLLNPPGFEWHHPHNNPNVVWLIRRCDHHNPMLQDYLHPNGRGGIANYF